MGYNAYSGGDDVIRIINEDCTGRKIGRAVAAANDAESVAKVFNAIIRKYGLRLKIERADENDVLKFLKADEEFSF